MSKKLVLGLDIGVASVGWGIIDKETGQIIDKGVRLFSEIDGENNEKRRTFRHIRRSLRRKEFRLYRTKRALLEMGLIDNIDFLPLNNPYEIRCKGLHAKLSRDELATAILHLMKRNGFRYDVADDEEGGTKTIKEDYLCEHQLNILNEKGKVRGIDNKYHFSLYKNEFLKLLEVQQVDEKYKIKLLEIFEKRRHFEEGPGGPNSPTIYGRYLSLNAEPINLIEKMRGHCSIFKDELRAPKICPSSEIFNLLNDLNNISIDGNHIGTERKEFIIQNYILDKGKITIKQLENYLGCSASKIKGFRIDKNEKPILTEIVSIKKIREICKKEHLPEFCIDNENDIYLLDEIFEILTHTKSIEERQRLLSQIQNPKFDERYIVPFSQIKGVSQYHSYSLKAIRLLTQEMYETNKNSQQIVVNLENQQEYSRDLKLPEDVVMSPVVVKSVNQTFKIIKAVMKKYGVLDTIMIEMTREKNSKDIKANIIKAQKNNEARKQHVLELVQDPSLLNKDLIDKIVLYEEQNGKSAYSLKPIDLKDLIRDPSKYEIDHIIPYSISLDDSKSNKVLVYSKENQIKGQRTPYQAMQLNNHDLCSFSDFEAYVATNTNFSRTKKENLLNKDDIYAGEVREGFINRNLADTRYMTRIVLNVLKNYLVRNDIETKVHVVNGSLTNKLRKVCKLPKNRLFYCHHAVDALLIASMLKSKYLESIIENRLVDEETGEIYVAEDDSFVLGPVAEAVAHQIKAFDSIEDYKFSYKVDTKPNRSISDQTLYGTTYVDGELYVIKKYKNIYEKDGETIAKMISTNDKKLNNLLIFKYDAKTSIILQKIVNSYPESKNPFAEYLKEHGFIRKYSKGGNGPIIQSLKYIENKVNVHLDVSDKYKAVPKHSKAVKLQLSPYRMDLYYSESKGQYRFVTIRYADIRMKNNYYYIDESFYTKQKQLFKIDESFKFVNTYHRGDLMERIKDDGSKEFDVFKTVNNPVSSTIESSFFGMETIKLSENGGFKTFQNMKTMSKNLTSIVKYSTDILGNKFLVKGERLKLRWK